MNVKSMNSLIQEIESRRSQSVQTIFYRAKKNVMSPYWSMMHRAMDQFWRCSMSDLINWYDRLKQYEITDQCNSSKYLKMIQQALQSRFLLWQFSGYRFSSIKNYWNGIHFSSDAQMQECFKRMGAISGEFFSGKWDRGRWLMHPLVIDSKSIPDKKPYWKWLFRGTYMRWHFFRIGDSPKNIEKAFLQTSYSQFWSWGQLTQEIQKMKVLKGRVEEEYKRIKCEKHRLWTLFSWESSDFLMKWSKFLSERLEQTIGKRVVWITASLNQRQIPFLKLKELSESLNLFSSDERFYDLVLALYQHSVKYYKAHKQMQLNLRKWLIDSEGLAGAEMLVVHDENEDQQINAEWSALIKMKHSNDQTQKEAHIRKMMRLFFDDKDWVGVEELYSYSESITEQSQLVDAILLEMLAEDATHPFWLNMHAHRRRFPQTQEGQKNFINMVMRLSVLSKEGEALIVELGYFRYYAENKINRLIEQLKQPNPNVAFEASLKDLSLWLRECQSKIPLVKKTIMDRLDRFFWDDHSSLDSLFKYTTVFALRDSEMKQAFSDLKKAQAWRKSLVDCHYEKAARLMRDLNTSPQREKHQKKMNALLIQHISSCVKAGNAHDLFTVKERLKKVWYFCPDWVSDFFRVHPITDLVFSKKPITGMNAFLLKKFISAGFISTKEVNHLYCHQRNINGNDPEWLLFLYRNNPMAKMGTPTNKEEKITYVSQQIEKIRTESRTVQNLG